MISRRAFMAGILGMLDIRRVHAQATAKVPKVGFLISRFGNPQHFSVFAEAMRALGFVPGSTVVIEQALGDPANLAEFRQLASQLVTSDVDVILAAGPQSIEAVRAVSRTVPIVGIDLESDPVARGWAATLARPGGNITGFFLDIPELSGKQ